jgi:hypothetical protein
MRKNAGDICREEILRGLQRQRYKCKPRERTSDDTYAVQRLHYINHDEVIQIFPENIIHHCLEGTGGVCKSKWHYQKLERSISRPNSSLWDIGVFHSNLVVTTADVQGGEILCTWNSIEYFIYPWYGALIFDGQLIKCTVVQTHRQASILLWGE